MDVGAALRDAREQRGISLDELSRTTKISVATLRALERNQIDRLPGGIFVRGFLRACAHEVGLDVEDTVQRYLAQFESRFGAVVATDTDGTRSESTRLGHPSQLRTLSVREAALLQTFPSSYVFDTPYMEYVCNIIGNALPCDFAEPLARQCVAALRAHALKS